MSKHVCVIDHSGVKHFHLTASQGSDEATVTVDLRKGRPFDLRFASDVKDYGIGEALESWKMCDDEDKFHQGLLDWRLSGMKYKAIGAMCNMSQQKVAAIVNPLKYAYHRRCDANKEKIEAILKREDPDYDFMTDRRTVIQEMCALLLGGEEMKQTLEQLCNMNLSTTHTPR